MVAFSELLYQGDFCSKVWPVQKMPLLVRVVITSDAKGSAEGGGAVADSVAQWGNQGHLLSIILLGPQSVGPLSFLASAWLQQCQASYITVSSGEEGSFLLDVSFMFTLKIFPGVSGSLSHRSCPLGQSRVPCLYWCWQGEWDPQEGRRCGMIQPLIQGRGALPVYLAMLTPGQKGGSAWYNRGWQQGQTTWVGNQQHLPTGWHFKTGHFRLISAFPVSCEKGHLWYLGWVLHSCQLESSICDPLRQAGALQGPSFPPFLIHVTLWP